MEVGLADVCSSRAARSLVIVFDAYEVVTEGNCSGCRRHDAKYPLSHLLISLHKVVSWDACLCANRSQSRAFDPGMIGHREWSLCAIRIFPNHRNMLSLPDNTEPYEFKRFDNSSFGCVNRKFGHYIATPASATKASSTGDSISRTS